MIKDEDFLVVDDGETSIVVFSSLGGPHHLDDYTSFDFTRFLSGVPCKKIFIRDSSSRWFCHGIAGADSVHELGWHISREIGERSLFIGHSAGGFAALLYGNLCGATQVVAFSPQTSIEGSGQWYGTMMNNDLSNIIDLREIISRGGVSSRVVYCEENKTDEKAAKHIVALPNVTIEADKGCKTHNSARHWIDNDKLLKLIKMFI